ncbi:DNA helicase/exodeoxyribonuclease V, subunit A [Alkalibacterium putridalgicola]|uniref:ATP-dependent helicase/nuclease subunit A n=1 Tax=Alkalibacterium putridalgicola TaxID=426703 RepID=A0A1H7S6C9_9LACT|nr:helicase-exonuclease AddAB subunit AddA [Alkalibacterium putridalgicola]GEK89077.1 ATP-dependent helicase/nuclease subunit A [Alkalibacterium putridalgicola]SEL68162.1 DNA helicase/exodeoxyribonuclease V, subunit A [Alkalibacterium putridalgicola]
MKTIPEKPENTQFTDHQWQAIHDEGKNLLVSASAGSGKTTVLVQRVIEKIKSRTDINELLVVTYTNAAAREMKQRIQSAIQKEINESRDADQKHHLIRQIPMLGHADISTLHSFCLKVIRRYYYLIDFDPVFRLLTDDTEIALMKEDVWDELREELYGHDNELFEELAAAYSSDKNDDGMTDLILSLYEFSRANPDPLEWLSGLSQMYAVEGNDLGQSFVFQKLIKAQILSTLFNIKELLDDAIMMANGEEELGKTLGILEDDLTHINALESLVTDNKLQEAYALSETFSHSRWYAPNKKDTPEAVKEAGREMKPFRDKAKDMYTDMVNDVFSFSPEEQLENMSKVGKLVEEMARVATLFYERYQAHKADRKVLDFNDLEHLTLRILSEQTAEGKVASEAAKHYRHQFKEVMIDEYQDINQIQEEILKWVTKPDPKNGNQFMVGDVKQSIYSFRLADPSLFIDKYERYATKEAGERIILAENFRSRKDVLSFTNFVFDQLMDKEVGDLTYDDSAKLINGFTAFPDSDDFQTEILIYESKEEEFEEEDEPEALSTSFNIDTKTKGELFMVASKILEMLAEGYEVYDKKAQIMRPLELKDIVLLTPTKKNNLDIQDIFKQLGIPTAVKDTQNYFQTTEITIMMSILKIIDNPQQDIPLVAVLRSPIVGLDEVELTRIRIINKQSSYFDALTQFADKDDWQDIKNIELQAKVQKFLAMLENWRKQSRRQSLIDLIWMIFEDTGFLHYVGGMSSGRQRKANLHALYERAAAYEKTSFKGLFQFIRFIEKMQKKDKDLAEPQAISDSENAVRVMTIHASKGLEFPIVFVLDMTKQFNVRDAQGATVFDEEYGVGAEYRDLKKREKKTTLPEKALKYKKKTKLLSEQMRVLYVALTRAEQKLLLVGSYKNEEAALERWGLVGGHPKRVLPSDMRLGARGFMDWIGFSIIRHEQMDESRSIAAQNNEIHHYDTSFDVHFYSQEELEEALLSHQKSETSDWYPKLKEGTIKAQADEEIKQAVEEAVMLMNKPYAYQIATQTTSYQSVSEIKRLFEEPDDGQMVKIDVTKPRQVNRYVEDQLSRPSFIHEDLKPTPAEVGQATHLVLQTLDLSEKPASASVYAVINRLVKENVFTPELAKLIRTEEILSFFKTAFGEYIIEHYEDMKREVPFSLLMEAQDIFHDMEALDDHVLIHGIIDGYIEKEDGIILFDYKTDRVAHLGQMAGDEMLKKYRGQLTLYKRALESILKKPVLESHLVMLDISETVRVN